jgi:inosine-uridine nucleoside N-ribohydrolase
MKKIPVWIDTDTGVDDAVALIVASKLDEIDLVGVSAVAGNTSLENAFGFILLFLVFGVRHHGKSSPRQFKDDMFLQNR